MKQYIIRVLSGHIRENYIRELGKIIIIINLINS